jgi:hypothetical protein
MGEENTIAILTINVATVPVFFGFGSEFRKSSDFGLILVFQTTFQFGSALF